MKCSECDHKHFETGNGSPNRYYCNNPVATAGVGARLICRTERHKTDITIKTSPSWCPLKKKSK